MIAPLRSLLWGGAVAYTPLDPITGTLEVTRTTAGELEAKRVSTGTLKAKRTSTGEQNLERE
jgi:hypothetical protein